MKAQKGKVLSTPFSLPFFSLVQQHGRTVVVKNAGSVLSSRALSAQVRVRVEGGKRGGGGSEKGGPLKLDGFVRSASQNSYSIFDQNLRSCSLLYFNLTWQKLRTPFMVSPLYQETVSDLPCQLRILITRTLIGSQEIYWHFGKRLLTFGAKCFHLHIFEKKTHAVW